LTRSVLPRTSKGYFFPWPRPVHSPPPSLPFLSRIVPFLLRRVKRPLMTVHVCDVSVKVISLAPLFLHPSFYLNIFPCFVFSSPRKVTLVSMDLSAGQLFLYELLPSVNPPFRWARFSSFFLLYGISFLFLCPSPFSLIFWIESVPTDELVFL